MIKKMAKSLLYVGCFTLLANLVISCEEDFTDIGTTIVSNNEFSTGDTVLEVIVTAKNIETVRADGLAIGGSLGQYLLGVYNNANYKKIEASIISQLQIPTNLRLVDNEYLSDTTVVTTIDTVFLKLPYQATLNGTDAIGPDFQLDSIIGDQSQSFTLNVFRLQTYLHSLNPTNPAVGNEFYSDQSYEIDSEKLNHFEDFEFFPNRRDTAQYVLRRLNSGDIYGTDTIQYTNSNPYINIPLKKSRIKELFLDQYESDDFTSQDAFNNYFRGLKIQARGNAGSMVSLSFTNTTFQPMVDIYYTNTVYRNSGTVIIDTIKKTDSFLLSGIRNSEYKMSPGPTPPSGKIPIQGTAGSMAQVEILSSDQLDNLRSQDWLVNDATLTLYVDKATVGSDTINTPFRLFAFKDGLTVQSQLIDAVTEGVGAMDGFLNKDSDGNPDNYTFKITDYISELISGNLQDLQPLGVKVFSPTDVPVPTNPSDTIVRNYSWNPKTVMLLNNDPTHGDRRPTLTISYSIKTLEED